MDATSPFLVQLLYRNRCMQKLKLLRYFRENPLKTGATFTDRLTLKFYGIFTDGVNPG
jgi:hypothetical protein